MHDPRLTPARVDIAAKYLQGKVAAARFVEGDDFEICQSIAPLRQAPAAEARLLTQALKGECVTIYDRNGQGWAWGQLKSDGYVGWLPDAVLARRALSPTHKVTALRTFAFPGPSIKLPPSETLVMGALVTIVRAEEVFAVTCEGWFLPRAHLSRLESCAPDFVAVAERFVGTPYLWGGKTSQGIDCSGLVQIALNAANIDCPRDSDMQQEAIGRPLDVYVPGRLQRGDLVFWKGHVAIARDAQTIVHASAFHMETVIERTSKAIARIQAGGSDIVAIKRF